MDASTNKTEHLTRNGEFNQQKWKLSKKSVQPRKTYGDWWWYDKYIYIHIWYHPATNIGCKNPLGDCSESLGSSMISWGHPEQDLTPETPDAWGKARKIATWHTETNRNWDSQKPKRNFPVDTEIHDVSWDGCFKYLHWIYSGVASRSTTFHQATPGHLRKLTQNNMDPGK